MHRKETSDERHGFYPDFIIEERNDVIRTGDARSIMTEALRTGVASILGFWEFLHLGEDGA